jgi:drug/metabolite transporter (DMT)-like permease
MLFAGIVVLPFGIVGARGMGFHRVDSSIWLWVAYIVVFPTILTYLLNIWALQRVSSNTVAVYVYLQPIFAALIAPLLLRGEGLTTRSAVAAMAIFAGLGLVLWAERRQERQIPIEPVGE